MLPKQEVELEKAVLQELEGIALEKMQCLREDIYIYTNLTKKTVAGITKNKTMINQLENLDKRPDIGSNFKSPKVVQRSTSP